MNPEQTPQNQPDRPARAVVYLRVSTDEQAESGAGLDAQLHACRLHAERAGLAVAGPFRDEGVSGAAPIDRRPGLSDAVAEVGPGDALVVAKRDRLGRDPIIVAMIESAVIRQGGRVVSAAGEGTDDDSPTSILMRRVIDAFAEFERLMIRARTKAAIGSLRRRGRVSGTIPYGYRAFDDGRPSKTSAKKDHPRPSAIVVNLEEMAVLARISLLSGQGYSAREVAAILTEEGIATRKGRPWHHNTIRAVLLRIKAVRPAGDGGTDGEGA